MGEPKTIRPELAKYLQEQDRGVLRDMIAAAANPETCTQGENQLARHLSYFIEATDALLAEASGLRAVERPTPVDPECTVTACPSCGTFWESHPGALLPLPWKRNAYPMTAPGEAAPGAVDSSAAGPAQEGTTMRAAGNSGQGAAAASTRGGATSFDQEDTAAIVAEGLAEGHIEPAGTDAHGEQLYRMTDAGKRYVEERIGIASAGHEERDRELVRDAFGRTGPCQPAIEVDREEFDKLLDMGDRDGK